MPDFGPLFEQPPRRVSLNTSLGRGGLSLEERLARIEDQDSYAARKIQGQIDAREADLRSRSAEGVIQDRAERKADKDKERAAQNRLGLFSNTLWSIDGLYANDKGLIGAQLQPSSHKENIATGKLGPDESAMIDYAYGMIKGSHPDPAEQEFYSKRVLSQMNRRFEEHHDDLLDSGPTTTGWGGHTFSARDNRGRPVGSTVGFTEGDLIKKLRDNPIKDLDGAPVHPALFAIWYRLRMSREANDRGLRPYLNEPNPDSSAIFLGARKDRKEGLPLASADRAPGAAEVERSRTWSHRRDYPLLGKPLKRFVEREGRGVESEASKAFKAQGGIDPEIPWFQRLFAKSGRESDDDWLERISNIR